ncbi:M28 family peptidase, partial [Patescibacteria group bacterium]|nr:M28 family peptidase [Patescibacteria group bacterium]
MNDIKQIFKEYQEVPNVPFQQRFTSQFVIDFLKSNNIEYKETNYIITIKKPSRNSNGRKLVLIAHLDHPGIVLKNNKEGVFLGLIGAKKLHAALVESSIDLRVFDPKGKYIGIVQLIGLEDSPKQIVNIKADFTIPRNSFGMFNVTSFKETTDTIQVYNADDGVMVSVMLDLIRNTKDSGFDLIFVFTKHEEVRQVSSWHLAKHNTLDIKPEDIIINLESLKTQSVNPEKYGEIDYNKGLTLQLSNIGCLFGYKNPGKNFAEVLLKDIAQRNGVPLQVGLIKDSCDSRPLTHFGLTPNICTLTIPNKYKHNGADDGKIRSEEILKKDIESVANLLVKALGSDIKTLEESKTESLSEKIKEDDDVTDLELMKERELVNERIEVSYKDIIRRG